jgi:hypothetical protein
MRTFSISLLLLLAACKDDVPSDDSGVDDSDAELIDADADGSPATEDCDDQNAAINPSAVELCDGIDNNCDDAIDNDATDAATWYTDADNDSFGDPGSATTACEAPTGAVSKHTDCDDGDSGVYPDAAELCDGVDNDCDADIDEDAIDRPSWYADADADGYGDAEVSVLACAPPSGFTDDDTDCDDTDARITTTCFPNLSGVTGSAWETLASGSEPLYSLQTYHLKGALYLFNMYDSTGQRYDINADTWETLPAIAPYSYPWTSMAPVGQDLYMIRNSNVYQYTPATDTWATLAEVSGGDDLNMTESDQFGVVYGHIESGKLVEYDTVSGALTYTTTGYGSQYETRMGYDPGTRSIFFGAYYFANLYKFDLTTKTVSVMASHPESQLNDIFCSDRSGHIYAAGGDSGTTMFQYTVATDTWRAIADLPADHGNNGSCTVSGDGWLYVGTGSNLTFYRLELY